MKTLEIKTTTLPGNLTYVDLIKAVVNQIDQRQGIVSEDQRKRLRILDALEGVTHTLCLEDADADLLQKLAKEMKWGTVSHDLVNFTDAVKDMKKVVEEPKS